MLKINEFFVSIQGEGKYAGQKVLFVRTSGCTRSCKFCDSKYHVKGKEYSKDYIINKILKNNVNIIVWTGGEPMLQIDEILKVIKELPLYEHHLETNGDILPPLNVFDYVCFSPKCVTALTNIINNYDLNANVDVKVVTDLKLNKDLLFNATMVMPLTTYDVLKDLKIMQNVWNYCIKKNKKFCMRQQYIVWGAKRGK